jgi:hypothetical protein
MAELSNFPTEVIALIASYVRDLAVLNALARCSRKPTLQYIAAYTDSGAIMP